MELKMQVDIYSIFFAYSCNNGFRLTRLIMIGSFMTLNEFAYSQRFGYFCSSGSPCSISLNLLQKLNNVYLFSTCSSAAIAETPSYV